MDIDLEDCRTSRMPDGDDNHYGWIIKRVGTDGPLKLVCLSNDIFGIRTHYYRGRTGPCLVTGCHCVASKQLSRWKGYLLAIDIATRQQVVFEFTPPGAATLDDARKQYGTLRGIKLIASRTSKRPNAKVVLAVAGFEPLGQSACPDYHVWPILARIWGVNSHDHTEVARGDLDDLSDFEKHA